MDDEGSWSAEVREGSNFELMSSPHPQGREDFRIAGKGKAGKWEVDPGEPRA